MENKLPKNWVETELKNLSNFVIGGDWGKDPNENYDAETELVYCIRGSELKNWNTQKGRTASLRKIKPQSLKKRRLQEGDILIEISGGGPEQPVGRTVYIDKQSIDINSEYDKVCTNFLRLIRLNDSLEKKFVQNYLRYFYLTGEVIKYQGGSNNLRNLKYKEFETIKIPLPPKSEQERIVAKLDHLFTELETLNQKLNQIPNLLKKCRQAILNQAVTGKLTKEWRKGKELDSIENNILNALENLEQIKTDRKKFIKSQRPLINKNGNWIKTQFYNLCVLKRGFDLPAGKRVTDGQYIIASSAGIISRHNEFKIDTGIVVGRSGSVGNTHWIEGKHWPLNTTLYVQDFCGNNKKFVYYYLLNFNFLKYSSSTAVPTLNRNHFVNELINIPPKEEQTEIVHRVEQLFTELDLMEAKYKTLKQQTDNLPQAILHKAFKGELVPQLATDGNAEDLLKEIRLMANS